MSGKIVFDTVAAIALLKGVPVSASAAALLDTSKWYASQITRIELYAYSKLSPEAEQNIRRFLSKVRIVPITQKIERETIALRRSKELKLPDALIAATAITLNAPLLTFDKHIRALVWPGLRCIPVDDGPCQS